MQTFGLAEHVKPSNWRQNASASKLTEITYKTGTPEWQQPDIE